MSGVLPLSSVRSGGLRWGEAVAVDVHAQGVDAERIRDRVQQLPTVPDAVRPPQPQRVVEVSVDAFGVVATSVEHLEVKGPRMGFTGRISRCDVIVMSPLEHHGR